MIYEMYSIELPSNTPAILNQIFEYVKKPISKDRVPMINGYWVKFALAMGLVSLIPAMTGSI